MGIFSILGKAVVGAGAVTAVYVAVKKIKELVEEDEMEKRVFTFGKSLSEEEFAALAEETAEEIRRLHVKAEGPVVHGTVYSNSGLSSFNFTLDFNDNGRLTGAYHMQCDPTDSSAPGVYADRLQDAIMTRLAMAGEASPAPEADEAAEEPAIAEEDVADE